MATLRKKCRRGNLKAGVIYIPDPIEVEMISKTEDKIQTWALSNSAQLVRCVQLVWRVVGVQRKSTPISNPNKP